MGLFRKSASLFTLGAVDFRDADGRTAKHTKKSGRELAKQTDELKYQTELMERQMGYEPGKVYFRGQNPEPASTPTPTPVGSVADELTKLVALRDTGAITEEEFSTLKQRLLGTAPEPSVEQPKTAKAPKAPKTPKEPAMWTPPNPGGDPKADRFITFPGQTDAG